MNVRFTLIGISLFALTFGPAHSAGRCDLAAPNAGQAGANCAQDWMDINLRVNDVVTLGTAESYKQRLSTMLMTMVKMGSAKDAKKLDFEMPAITEQLDNGARMLSFDVAYDPKGGALKNPAGSVLASEFLPDSFSEQMSKPGFKTVHVLDVDYRSNCQPLAACLESVKAWSLAHPQHIPILIALSTNDEKTPMPRATNPLKIDAAALNALDAEVRKSLGDRLLTPDMVQGQYPTLREAVTHSAWPQLNEARGKIMVVLKDSAEKITTYQGARKSLEGRAMFVTADENSPAAAIVAVDDPISGAPRIAAAVKAGFIVTTRADADTLEARSNDASRRTAALASGAQYVATNFMMPDKKIGPYQVQLAQPGIAACNVVLVAQRCQGMTIEPRGEVHSLIATSD